MRKLIPTFLTSLYFVSIYLRKSIVTNYVEIEIIFTDKGGKYCLTECCMASAVSCVLTFPDQVGGGWSTAAQPSLVPCHLDNKVGGGAQLLAPAAAPQ